MTELSVSSSDDDSNYNDFLSYLGLVSTPPPIVLSMDDEDTDTTTTDSDGPPELVRSNDDDGESESEGRSEGGSLSSTEDDDDETISVAGFSDIAFVAVIRALCFAEWMLKQDTKIDDQQQLTE